MSRNIPRSFVRDLLSKADIVDVVRQKVEIKKKGKLFYSLCPFHQENNPSFTVNEERQLFYCFGCGAKGNAIDFLMGYEGMNFADSVSELSHQVGLEVPRGCVCRHDHVDLLTRQKVYEMMDNLATYYHDNLRSGAHSSIAREYISRRGLDQEIVSRFRLGFSSPGNEILRRFADSEEKLQILEQSGIIRRSGSRRFDVFQDRIIFPIRDSLGRVVAFGARSLDDRRSPRYINSPRTKVFEKDGCLYGFYEIKNRGTRPAKVLLVEGYMDVLTLHRFGLGCCLAALGTNISKRQIDMVYRLSDHVVCCYDGDDAGYAAAWRTLERMTCNLSDGRDLSFLFLPKNEDPDSVVRKIGRREFERKISGSLPFSEFLFGTLIRRSKPSSLEGRAKLIRAALSIIGRIPGEVLRFCLRRRLGVIAGIGDDSRLEKLVLRRSIPGNETSASPPDSIGDRRLRSLIGLLVQHPRLASAGKSAQELERMVTSEELSLFTTMVKICLENPGISSGQLLESCRDSRYFPQIQQLAHWNHMIPEDRVELFFSDVLFNLYRSVLRSYRRSLASKDWTGLRSDEKFRIWKISKILSRSSSRQDGVDVHPVPVDEIVDQRG